MDETNERGSAVYFVKLRLISAGGDEAKVIAYLYGGQRTINVPSWSPDSKQTAFVSNSGN